MKNKETKYSSLSNLCFIYKNLWIYDKSVVIFAAEVLTAVIEGFGAVLLPSLIIGMIEKHIAVPVMIGNMIIISAIYGMICTASFYIRDRNDF